MASTPPKEETKSTILPMINPIPKYSWETETQCDEFSQDIPTYSWEYDASSPTYIEGSTSTIVPDREWLTNIQPIPKFSWETESQCDEYTQDIPTYSCEADSCTRDNVLSPKIEDGFIFSQPKYDTQPEYPDQNRVINDFRNRQMEDVQPSQLLDKSITYGGNTSNECKDQYYDFEFAQIPESPNLNIEFDAITELCN